MDKPVLVIMAAGMGSRYGGLKQIDAVDDAGHIIMDYSIHDAIAAGFEKVVFIIKKENEQLFRTCIGDRISSKIEVKYCYQDINDLPEGYKVPEGRVKPWGTGHAVLAARNEINGPFAAINADDYYGAGAFHKIYDFLVNSEDGDHYSYTMIGYLLKNTITENGYVSRGVCKVDENGNLIEINERTHIEKIDGVISYSEDDGKTWHGLDDDTVVSMNMWGFSLSMMRELEKSFPDFLKNAMENNPLKAEYYLPTRASDLVKEGLADVKVLVSEDKWFGVTYQEDRPVVKAGLKKLCDEGKYTF